MCHVIWNWKHNGLFQWKISVQTNVFTTGDLDIGLKEPDWDPNENDGKNMYPGYTVYKNPTVKNITSDKKRGRALLCENECGTF